MFPNTNQIVTTSPVLWDTSSATTGNAFIPATFVMVMIMSYLYLYSTLLL
jgi:hypothetical protein